MELHFKLLQTFEERKGVFPLYQQLNPRLSQPLFNQRMAALMQTNYQLLAVYNNTFLVAIAGYWINHRLYCGKYLEPDNVVVAEAFRSQNVGEKLHKELERIALANNCRVMMLDAYLDNKRAHEFYERQGYKAKGYHFIKKLQEEQ